METVGDEDREGGCQARCMNSWTDQLASGSGCDFLSSLTHTAIFPPLSASDFSSLSPEADAPQGHQLAVAINSGYCNTYVHHQTRHCVALLRLRPLKHCSAFHTNLAAFLRLVPPPCPYCSSIILDLASIFTSAGRSDFS